jgi:hypothetical protein
LGRRQNSPRTERVETGVGGLLFSRFALAGQTTAAGRTDRDVELVFGFVLEAVEYVTSCWAYRWSCWLAR